MKKTLALLLAVATSVALIGCKSSPNISDTLRDLGEEAYSIMGSYFNGTITSDECADILEDIDSALNTYIITTDDYDDSPADWEYGFNIDKCVLTFKIDLKSNQTTNLESSYNDLGDILGK